MGKNLRHIKRIDEFFDVGVFGDTYGYGGGNGVFKIAYKPFSDLSVSVGPDTNVPRKIEGANFQIGDIVLGTPVDKDKGFVAGMIVKTYKDKTNKGYRIYVQVTSKKEGEGEGVIELKPETVQYVNMGDKGHKEIVSGFEIPDKVGRKYNSDKVYTSSDLGIETVGG